MVPELVHAARVRCEGPLPPPSPPNDVRRAAFLPRRRCPDRPRVAPDAAPVPVARAVNTKKTPAQAVLYVPPKMTKTEVKEYLTKIYNVSVLEVMTSNLLGTVGERASGRRHVRSTSIFKPRHAKGIPSRAVLHALIPIAPVHFLSFPVHLCTSFCRKVEAVLRKTENCCVQAEKFQEGDSRV